MLYRLSQLILRNFEGAYVFYATMCSVWLGCKNLQNLWFFMTTVLFSAQQVSNQSLSTSLPHELMISNCWKVFNKFHPIQNWSFCSGNFFNFISVFWLAFFPFIVLWSNVVLCRKCCEALCLFSTSNNFGNSIWNFNKMKMAVCTAT